MKCEKCGKTLNNDAKFCQVCGYPVNRNNNVKKILLKCEHCGGTLEINSNQDLLMCPFCGSKSIIIENDDVKIERIKANAYNEVEFKRIDSENDLRRTQKLKEEEESREQEIDKFKHSFVAKLLLIGVIACGFISYKSFTSGKFLSAIISLLQTGIFASAWCMGMDIIHEKKKYIRIIVIIIGLMLFFPSVKSCTVDKNLKSIPTIKWSVIVVGDKIPEPKSKSIEINENSETKLWIEVYDVPDEDYYEYIAFCKDRGFNQIQSENSLFFEAYNNVGDYIDLIHDSSNEELSIRFEIGTVKEPIEWDKRAISAHLPKPKSEYGSFEVDNNERIEFILSDNSSNDYEDYKNSCINYGYTIDSETSADSYEAYNDDGCFVWLKYNEYNKEISVHFKYPMEFKQIEWPNKGIGSLTPIPKSTSVNIGNDYDWVFNVYVENMTFDDYEEYVKQCNEAGFDKNVRNYGDSYWAEYSDDIEIHVSYEGYNIINIDITGLGNKDYSTLRRK